MRPPMAVGARTAPEKALDLLLAASVASWAVAGAPALGGRTSLVRGTIVALHLAVALHLSARSRERRRASTASLLASLPALGVAGLAFVLAAPIGSWPGAAEILFASGALLAMAAFASLGKSFAVLPGVRGVVTRGAYRLVRHPAYLGEIVMVLSCTLSRPSPAAIAVALAALPLVAVRIRAEESVLLELEAYRVYVERVRYRLVPGLW